jgi:tRNA A37 threonylcarbamoyladenosine dehydratase
MMTEDYLQRFGGLGRLYGAAALPRLHAAHVCVVGVGGVGSWVVEGLARSGIGAITMIDLDDVCVTNVNRQLPALDGNIGRPKVAALAERVRLINPACAVATVSEYFTAKTADALLATRYSWVVDCIDLMSNKALLIAECSKRGQPVLTVGSAGGKRDATRIVVTDFGGGHGDELLRQVRKKLRRDSRLCEGRGQPLRHPLRVLAGGTGLSLGRRHLCDRTRGGLNPAARLRHGFWHGGIHHRGFWLRGGRRGGAPGGLTGITG